MVTLLKLMYGQIPLFRSPASPAYLGAPSAKLHGSLHPLAGVEQAKLPRSETEEQLVASGDRRIALEPNGQGGEVVDECQVEIREPGIARVRRDEPVITGEIACWETGDVHLQLGDEFGPSTYGECRMMSFVAGELPICQSMVIEDAA